MRLFVKSEPEAFRLTVATVFVVGVAIALGYLIGPLAGVIAFAVVALIALAHDVASARPGKDVLHEAERTGHEQASESERGRILVIANEALTGEVMREEILKHKPKSPVLDVIAPVLQSRSHFMTTDIDRETRAARQRLRQTLRCAADYGIEATGVVGDPIAPLATVEDELRRYNVEEVIVATHPLTEANWVEARILERAKEELSVPIRHLVVNQQGEKTAVS
jgi:hypothetical protein